MFSYKHLIINILLFFIHVLYSPRKVAKELINRVFVFHCSTLNVFFKRETARRAETGRAAPCVSVAVVICNSHGTHGDTRHIIYNKVCNCLDLLK